MWPTIITGTIATLAWAKTIHCIKRCYDRDGNYEGVGILLVGPVAVVTTILAIVFGVIWALS